MIHGKRGRKVWGKQKSTMQMAGGKDMLSELVEVASQALGMTQAELLSASGADRAVSTVQELFFVQRYVEREFRKKGVSE